MLSRRSVTFRGFAYTLLFLALWTLSALLCRALDPFIPVDIPAGLRSLGLIFISCGALLSFATAANFGFHGRGTPALFDPPKQFVGHGLHRYVRNPMYIGYVVAILGMGLVFRSAAIVLFAVMAFGLIHAFVVFAEEPGLRRRFGQRYEEYCRSVPRWIPRTTPARLPA